MRLKLWITWICVLAMLVTMLAACGTNGGDEANGSSTSPSGAQGNEEDTGNGTNTPPVFDYETGDRLDPTLNYENEDFQIFTWNTQQVTEWVEETSETASQVERTLYEHLENAKDRLNLNITIREEPGRYAQMDSYLDTLTNLTSTGLDPDLVCQYSLTASKGMIRGLYGNLLETAYLDFDAPWWNESLVEGNTINGNLYYITGDLTPTIIYNMYAVIFNKTLLNQYDIEAPYDLVRTGNWTLEALLELIRGTAVNPNADGIYTGSSENVMYGLNIQKLSVDAFQSGFGITALERNADGQWQLTQEFSGSRAVDIVDTLRTLVYDNEDVFYDKESQYAENIFKDEKTIFDVDTLGMVDRVLSDKDMQIGVAPVPKYDAIQRDYATRLSVMISMFSITKGCKDPDRSSAVLEAMGSDGYHEVTPVVFEDTFGLQYANAPDDAEMYILIRDSIVYDPGNTQDALSSYSSFRNCVYYDMSWETFFEQRLPIYAEAITNINGIGLETE